MLMCILIFLQAVYISCVIVSVFKIKNKILCVFGEQRRHAGASPGPAVGTAPSLRV